MGYLHLRQVVRFITSLAAAALLAHAITHPAAATPVKTHPRLWVRASDIPELQSRMVPTNPLWVSFNSFVQTALADYQNGKVPNLDPGWHTGNIPYTSELWGMVFAFMSLIEPNATQKQMYTTAAKDCLMHIINQAYLGPGTPDANGNYPPFRHPDFPNADRGFYNEAFPLMVDWLQAQPGVLTADDLGKIRKTFLWWALSSESAVYFSPNNPNHLVNDPTLLHLTPPASSYDIDNRAVPRDALNNHYANRLRMQIMMALAFDPANDVSVAPGDIDTPGALTGYIVGPGGPADWLYQNKGYLRLGTGSWLYLTDYGLRHDTGNGMSPEGLEYMSNGLGPIAFAMLMLQTAGQDDPNQWGPQVVLNGHPFWKDSVDAFLHQLPPSTRFVKDYEHVGPSFDMAWYGDGENYVQNDQYIKVLAPLALADQYRTGNINEPRTQAVRYIEQYLAPGGAAKFASRITSNYGNRTFRDAIQQFLLYDPDAAAPTDPRLSLPNTVFSAFNPAGTMGSIHSRTGLGENQSYFDYRLGWMRIDHQHGDGNSFELWRNGVWLTKRSIGYGAVASNADYNNAFTIQNNTLPINDTFENHKTANRHGSQYTYSQAADPALVAKSLAQNFLYVSGDASGLYNIYSDAVINDVQHASRSIVWLKPDYVVVYDRATTATAGRFKRFWLSLSDVPQISGNTTHTTVTDTHYVSGVLTSTPKAELFTTTLLPVGATLSTDLRRQMTYSCQLADHSTVDCDTPAASQCVYADSATGRCNCPAQGSLPPEWNGTCPCQCGDQTAAGEPMDVRLRVDAPGGPANSRFLNVLQSSDLGATQNTASSITSSSGNAYDGAVVNNAVVLFPVNLDTAFAGMTYSVPNTTTGHLITGLTSNAVYYVTQQTNGGMTTVTVNPSAPGTQAITDSGGVLVLGSIEPANVSIVATDPNGAEADSDPLSFTINRSGSTAAALVVHYSLSGTATNGSDYGTLNGAITIAAESVSAVLTVAPINDPTFEGTETVVVKLTPDAAYFAADGVNSASGQIADNDPPPGGFLQFSSATYNAAENVGIAALLVTRSGSSSGSVSVLCTTSNGSALAGSDYTSTSATLTWGPGETVAKACNVPILDDTTYEANETVLVTLSNATGQAAVGVPGSATLTIVEDDPAPPGQIVLNTSTVTVAEGGGSVTLTVKRINGTGGAASVNYATSNGSATAGSDYTANSGTLMWASGDNTDQTITINITSDDLYEGGDETFSFDLSGATIALGTPSSATITIIDDDPQPLEYDVGPGWPFPTISDVPWQSLVAASIVRIHGEGSPYHEKFLISSRGTAAQPIQVLGIAGPAGQPVVIDGANATSSAALHYVSSMFTESHSIVAVARDTLDNSGFKPGYIEIDGLEIRNATGNFTTTTGQPATYSSFAAAVLLQGAEHVSVRHCVLHDSANGLMVESQGSEADVARDVLVQNNHIYSNGWAGNYNGRNIQIQAAGVRIEANRLDTPVNGSNAYNVEDHSSGAVIRYNRIEGGGRLVQLSDSNSAVIRAEADYGKAMVYGNLLLDGPNNPGSLVFYGGDSGTTGNYRKGTLYFFHNTIVIDSTEWEPSVFALATNAESLDARNNIFYRHPVGISLGSASLRLMPGNGVATLGNNWISSGWQAGGNVTYNPGTQIVGTLPGFVDYANGDLHLATNATARDQGGGLNAATVGTYDVTEQYVDVATLEQRPVDAAGDLGAFEFGSVLPTPTRSATTTGTATTTVTPTATVSVTPTTTPTTTASPSVTVTPTVSPTGTATVSPTVTATPTSTPLVCSAGVAMRGARLALKGTPFALRLTGNAVLPKPWVAVDPLNNGFRVAISDDVGTNVDRTVPGGAKVNGTGWTINATGRRWVYVDPAGSIGGIKRIVIRDRSLLENGRVSWFVIAKGDAIALPDPNGVRAAVVVGSPTECAAFTWNGPLASRPRCNLRSGRLVCR